MWKPDCASCRFVGRKTIFPGPVGQGRFCPDPLAPFIGDAGKTECDVPLFVRMADRGRYDAVEKRTESVKRSPDGA